MHGSAPLLANRDVPATTYRLGTHRVVSPAETLARVRPLLSRAGITRVANVTGLDTIGLPVVMVCRPNSRSLSVSQGKGLDLDAAKASGVMESLESYHAERIVSPLKLASWQEMREAHRVVDVDGLAARAGAPCPPELSMLWIEGEDVLSDEMVWVPYDSVHLNFARPGPTSLSFFPVSSNGLASGNHVLEAISHGICEVVERDALAAADGPPHGGRVLLDLATVDDPTCVDVLDTYDRAGVDVLVWDVTSDIGLACFACAIWERDPSPLRPLYTSVGSGCHPDRSIALVRALTEAAQSRLTFIAGARDDLPRHEYDDLMAQRPPEVPPSAASHRHFHDVPSYEGHTPAADVYWELERLTAVGAERVVVVDLTKPEFGVPVVRVLIPGLEGPRGWSPTSAVASRRRT